MSNTITMEETVKRLKKWKALLERRITKPKKGQPLFDMKEWGRPLSAERGDSVPENFCGTAACALGCAGLDPWFRKRGLRMIRKNRISQHFPVVYLRPHLASELTPLPSHGEHAARDFFGITHVEALTLTSPYHYYLSGSQTTEQHVIDRLEGLITTYERLLPPKVAAPPRRKRISGRSASAREREEFKALCLENGLTADDALAILRDANTIQRIAVEECNRELSEQEKQADKRAVNRIRVRCARVAGVVPSFSGDPRGAVVKIRFPSGEWNSMGGPEDGWCVPVGRW